jgi:hypothetical protein
MSFPVIGQSINIMILSGGACQVRYQCGHMAMFAAKEMITFCQECNPDQRFFLHVVK